MHLERHELVKVLLFRTGLAEGDWYMRVLGLGERLCLIKIPDLCQADLDDQTIES